LRALVGGAAAPTYPALYSRAETYT